MKSSKRGKVMKRIESLKADRKKKYIQTGIAFGCVIVMVIVKTILETAGILAVDNSMVGSGMIVVAFLLAILGGLASMDASKLTKEIKALSQKCGIYTGEEE